MNFGELKANVQSAMGRSDVPDYVYTLTTAGVNRDCKFLDMQSSATITTATNPATLPADFHSVVSAYISSGGSKAVLKATTDYAAQRDGVSRVPRYYSVRGGKMFFAPEPDGTYTVYLEYISKLAAFSGDGDTNDVIARYPDLFLYQALTHAAIWAKDSESEQSYGNAYAASLKLANRDDMSRKFGTPLASRSERL